MKRTETKVLENILRKSCFGTNPKLAKEYGTTEVTIDFQRNRNKKEIVDFLSYDATKDIYKCYEIKVSMSDFRSKAKKSWCGNYNYLVLTSELYEQQPLSQWRKEIPDYIGIIVINHNTFEKTSVVKAKYREISPGEKNMLKTSLLRTLFYQNQKLLDNQIKSKRREKNG